MKLLHFFLKADQTCSHGLHTELYGAVKSISTPVSSK
jgi:hypothetical protein